MAVIALAGISLRLPGPPEALLPRTVLALAGPALAPLLLVSLVATMQSSADSVLLSAAAATSHDLLPGPGGARRARLLVVAFGILGLLVALVLRDLLATFRLGYTLFASSLILPTLAALLAPGRVGPGWAGASMVTGAAAALASRLLWPGTDAVLPGTAACAAVLLLGIGIRAAAGRPDPRLEAPPG